MSDDEIMRVLTGIDSIMQPQDTISIGPFSVFQVVPTVHRTVPLANNAPDDETPTEKVKPSTSFDELQSVSMSVVSTEAPSYCNTIDNSSPSDIELHTNSQIEPVDIDSPRFGLSMPLFRDAQMAQLIYHFTNHVTELLQPVLHPGNPWRTTYLSFALQGCPNLWLSQTATPTASSKASLSLFHSLLAAAAFHLRNSADGSVNYHKLALQHRIKALQALNSASPQPYDEKLYLVQLTAMLSLVTVDVRLHSTF